MNKCNIESCKIKKLKKDILEGNSLGISEFWEYIEKNHTPIIEEVDGDSDHALVTFVYKGDKDTKNVVVLSSAARQDYNNSKMERIFNTDIWVKSFIFKNNLRFDYEIAVNHPLNDDWEKRLKSIKPDPYANLQLIIPEDEENIENTGVFKNVVELPNVVPKKWTISKDEVPKGKINMIRFKSDILNDSYRIWIYTPAGYSNEQKAYKALVLSDGFEYVNAHSTPIVLDNLIYKNKISPMVAIFIESKANRMSMLRCNKDFADFVANEVMCWFRENYNISNKAEDIIIAGLSLGGLFATYLGINYSNIFGNVLSQSGSFWWCPDECDRKDYEEVVWMGREIESREKLKLKFYLEVGSIEENIYGSMIKGSKSVRDVLLSKGYNVKYSEFPGGHDDLSWGETLANGIIYLTEE